MPFPPGNLYSGNCGFARRAWRRGSTSELIVAFLRHLDDSRPEDVAMAVNGLMRQMRKTVLLPSGYNSTSSDWQVKFWGLDILMSGLRDAPLFFIPDPAAEKRAVGVAWLLPFIARELAGKRPLVRGPGMLRKTGGMSGFYCRKSLKTAKQKTWFLLRLRRRWRRAIPFGIATIVA